MRGALINVLFSVVLLCPSLSTSEEERFFWSAEFVSKPNNYYPGAPSQIPVIGGEVVDIQCQVRAVSEDPYTIIWDYENFNATTTGKTILVNNTAGDEFAVDTITVNINNPAVIDDKDIICSWENGKFSDTISLQFKVYVEDKSKGTCPVCDGGEHVKLVRPGKPRKEDANMQEMIKEKAKKKYGKSGFSKVFIDSKGSVCCCKAIEDTPDIPITITTTTTTKEAPIMTEAPKITTIIRKTALTTTTPTTTAKTTTTTTASTTAATTTSGLDQIILVLRNFILPILPIFPILFFFSQIL